MTDVIYSVGLVLAWAVLAWNIYIAYQNHKNCLRLKRQLRVLKAYIDYYKAQAKKDGVVIPLPAYVDEREGVPHGRNNHNQN